MTNLCPKIVVLKSIHVCRMAPIHVTLDGRLQIASNPYSVDNLCDDAYNNPYVNLTVIEEWPCGQNPSEFGPWLNQGNCNGVFPQYFFLWICGGTGDYQIEFTIFACAGTGVQYGITMLYASTCRTHL